jgi:hypothetical protein
MYLKVRINPPHQNPPTVITAGLMSFKCNSRQKIIVARMILKLLPKLIVFSTYLNWTKALHLEKIGNRL